jgi:hypothetical protein
MESSSTPKPAAPSQQVRLTFSSSPEWLAIRYADDPSPGWYFLNRVRPNPTERDASEDEERSETQQ